MYSKLQGLILKTSDYIDIETGTNNVLYLDPPYSTGTKFKTTFNITRFWEWVREQSMINYVYTSEYNAPKDFISIWKKQHKTGIDHAKKTHKLTTENLFVYKEGLLNA